MQYIVFEQAIKKPAETIFSCLTEQHHLQRWFAPQVIITPVKNTHAAFAFEFDLSFKILITELEENKSVCWEVTEGIEGWTGSVISFTLTDQAGQTQLQFEHKNLSGDDEKIRKWRQSWNDFLRKLADYATHQV